MYIESTCLLNSLIAFSFFRKGKTESGKFQKSFKIQALYEALKK